MTNAPYGYPGNSNPYPGAPPVSGGTRPATPGSVTGAFLIYLLAAVIGVVSLLLLVNSSVWTDAVNQAAADASSGVDAQTLVNTAKTLTIVFAVVFAALFLFFAFMMRAGRNWARIVLTVLSALSLLSALRNPGAVTVGSRTYSSTSNQLIGYLSPILAIVAIVLMFLPVSNTYFRNALAFRKGGPR